MNQGCWRLVALLARTLEPEEREVVRGDIMEAGENGAQALRDICGLVVRRQLETWTDWRPWIALFGWVMPCGWLMMFQSRTLGRGYAEFFWILRNYADLDPEVLQQTGLTPVNELLRVVVRSLLMIVACWSAGFLLASLSPRARWINGMLFVVFAAIPAMTVSQFYPYEVQGPLPLWFYTIIVPMLQQLLLCIVPALLGILPSKRGMFARLSET